ncbi:P-loop containing nucleoside triphosphate hydrolase protein [Dactylonectria estremocensis]|uniref:P-loop containing nucleoside triphosphate hydrolase protein n=1 Tax=Dactylonectria estremocensis TaxID=1079267 RepID=A0A9P9J046_9HYPO|nr:P-loop containing nucleoside triphosphate hydrolase protein [Dactylonectria estremocensis]
MIVQQPGQHGKLPSDTQQPIEDVLSDGDSGSSATEQQQLDTQVNSDAVTTTQQDENGGGDAKSDNKDSGFKYYLRVFTYNDLRGWIFNAIAIVAMIAAGTVLPIMDIIFGRFINAFNGFVNGTLSPAGYRSEVGKYSLYFIYLFIAKFVLTYIWTMLISLTAIRTTKALRIDFVRQTLRQEVSFFDSPSSSISGQITTNGNLINHGISEKLGLIITGLSTFFAAFIVAFAVQWKLTLIVVCIVPVNIIVTVICVAIDIGYEYAMFDIYSRSGSLAEEAFATIRTAHAFWAFPKLSKRFTSILNDAGKIGAKKSLVYAILFPTEFFCIFSGYGLAFWQGIRMYSTGEITQPGTVVTVIFAVLVAATALTQIAPQTIAISKATAAAQEMFQMIDRESKIDSLSEEGDTIPIFRGDIKLRSLRFAYPSRPDIPVLQGLDLDIPAEKTTAFVGSSGSGKSTIFGLLERWYQKGDGSITLDGHPVEQLNLKWLRTNIRMVQQEPTLFSGSIFQNVADGLTGTDLVNLPEDERRKLVVTACEAAFAHDFIERLPNGYDTVIGERGASLSGGQKQRVVIARSIISNPKVLMLDEATSALDPNAEKIVQRALNNVAKGRTMIVIAHRLSTIRDADNIIVMAKGAAIEQGSHNDLIDFGGVYSRLVRLQDLGHGGVAAQEEAEAEKEEPLALLETVISHASAYATHDVSDKNIVNYGLLKCLYIIMMEQKSIWWPNGVILILISLFGGLTYPAIAILFSRTMNAFANVDVKEGNFYSLMFFVVALANAVIYAAGGWAANNIGQHVMKVYRGEIFNNTLRQDMTFFDDPDHGTGSLVSRLSTEPTSIQELLSMNVALILINMVTVLSSSILAIAYGWKLGLTLVFGALPVLVFSGYVRVRLEYKFDVDTAARFAKSSNLASEAVLGIRTVSSLALEGAVIERYSSALEGLANEAIAGLGWKMLFYALSQSASFLAMALGFWYGGRLVSTGEYTTEQFYIIFIGVVFSGESAAIFFQYSTSVSKARTAINYILRLRKQVVLHDDEGDDADASSASSEKRETGNGPEVICNAVGFAYPRRPKLQVLRDIDIKIESGKMVALVGASGCGKSTMVALLERFYDPTTGELRSDGQDIKTRNRRLYRRDIALVQQEPVLYQGSIRDNISLGVETGIPDDEAIIDCLKQANIYDFVASLPEGLNTPCGNQGLSLSGGQRQRIAIARALIRRPRLLLLDEATSALDTESEKVVKEALDRAAQGRTTVAVAHRLSTIRDADVIVVFAGGRVVQMGTHEELVARRGLYYEMVLGQSLDREGN